MLSSPSEAEKCVSNSVFVNVMAFIVILNIWNLFALARNPQVVYMKMRQLNSK